MPEEERKRSGCLTALLILMLIVNPLIGLIYFLAGSNIKETFTSAPDWAIPTLGLFAFANFVFALAIWKWKKWGVYGFGISSIVIFAINLSIGIPVIQALFGLAGFVILIILLRPVWNYLE